SENRAKAVLQALLDQGIEPKRLRARGFGMSQPVATNNTEEGRQKNRRTQFMIWAK
ncbi:MAG TPA: OmpA family protein, partial [Candidatus Kapabacteria bacterium]|nr:OmpA family protein [Candidatus Kapabacteria bacterium]